MKMKGWGCSCCNSPACGCQFNCNNCYLPADDIILTLYGMESSPENTCIGPYPFGLSGPEYYSILDTPITLEIPLYYTGNSFGTWDSYCAVPADSDAGAGSGAPTARFMLTCTANNYSLSYNSFQTVQEGLCQKPGVQTSKAIARTNNTCDNLVYDLSPPLNRFGSCLPTVKPFKQYNYVSINRGSNNGSGYCVRFCLTCAPDPSGDTITVSRNGETIAQGITGLNKCVNLNIGTSGYYDVVVSGPGIDSVTQANQYLQCGTHVVNIPPCWYKPIQNGNQWQFKYNRSFQKASLDYLDRKPVYEVTSNCVASQSCGISYCLPVGVTPASPTGANVGGNWCHVNGACIDCYKGPYQTPTIEVIYNPTTITFNISSVKDPVTLGFNSDIHLLYAYITKYTANDNGPCYSPRGCDPCTNNTGSQERALVTYAYGGMVVGSNPNVSPCSPPVWAISYAVVPGINTPQPDDCGTTYSQCGVILSNGQTQHCTVYGGFCSIDAARSFASNLPQTIQVGEYGSVIGGGTLPYESFPSNPTGVVVTCDKLTYYNYHSSYDCNGNVIFDGYNVLEWSL